MINKEKIIDNQRRIQELKEKLEEKTKENKSLRKTINYYRYHYLTGMKQRHDFEYDLREKLEKSEEPFYLVMLDVNNLHGINRTKGYAEGDRLLIEVANDIKMICKECGEGYHIGGDEFYVITDDDTADITKFSIDNCEFGAVNSIDFIHSNEMLDAVDKIVIEKKTALNRRSSDETRERK